MIGYEPNKLKCDNWNYDDLVKKELIGTVESIKYGTNCVQKKTKTYVDLILDDKNARKIRQFCYRNKTNALIVHHRIISLTNPILKVID